MAMGFVGAALCGFSADSTEAMALVPPVMGLLAGAVYLAMNRRRPA